LWRFTTCDSSPRRLFGRLDYERIQRAVLAGMSAPGEAAVSPARLTSLPDIPHRAIAAGVSARRPGSDLPRPPARGAVAEGEGSGRAAGASWRRPSGGRGPGGAWCLSDPGTRDNGRGALAIRLRSRGCLRRRSAPGMPRRPARDRGSG
jgi:hypothetical protein